MAKISFGEIAGLVIKDEFGNVKKGDSNRLKTKNGEMIWSKKAKAN